MNSNTLNLFTVILLYATFGWLSFRTIANPFGTNRRANLYFGACLLLWATLWLDEAVTLAIGYYIPQLILWVHLVQFFVPFIFYTIVSKYLGNNYSFKWLNLIYLGLPTVFLAVLVDEPTTPDFFQFSLPGILIAQASLYTLGSHFKNHNKPILLFSAHSQSFKWLEFSFLAMLSMTVVFCGYNLLFNPIALHTSTNTAFAVVIGVVAFHSLRQSELFPIAGNLNTGSFSIAVEQLPNTVKRRMLPDVQLDVQKAALVKMMVEQKPYLDPELNLIKLAKLAQISPHQLSHLINAGFEENFVGFISKYRVAAAQELLESKSATHLSMLGIAFESGFNSKTSFNQTFKKITGKTPSDYKREKEVPVYKSEQSTI